MLIIEISNHDANKVISSIQMSWAVEVVKVAIVRRCCDELIPESFWRQNQNWLQFLHVKMNEGNHERDENRSK